MIVIVALYFFCNFSQYLISHYWFATVIAEHLLRNLLHSIDFHSFIFNMIVYARTRESFSKSVQLILQHPPL